MNKLRKSEVFSLLQPVGSGKHSLTPAHAAHELFKGLRPNLEQQPWDPDRSYTVSHLDRYTHADISHKEMTVDDSGGSGFVGNITWLVDGPSELTSADNPPVGDCVEEKLYLHSPEWRQQASIEFIRNVIALYATNLSEGRAEESLIDLRYITMSFEANASNDRDRLRVGFSASSGFSPKGYISESARVINGAPAPYDAVDPNDYAAVDAYIKSVTHESLNPGKDDIAALRVSVELLRKALAYLRQSPSV